MKIRIKLLVSILGIALISSLVMVWVVTDLQEQHDTIQEQTHLLNNTNVTPNHAAQVAVIDSYAYATSGDTLYKQRAQQRIQQLSQHLAAEQEYDQQHQELAVIVSAVNKTLTRVENGVPTAQATQPLLTTVDASVIQDPHTASITGPLNAAKQFIQLASYILLIAASIFGLLLARSISIPLQRIQRTIEAISRGNLDTDISQEDLDRDDEIGALARAFNRTLTSLKLAMRRTEE